MESLTNLNSVKKYFNKWIGVICFISILNLTSCQTYFKSQDKKSQNQLYGVYRDLKINTLNQIIYDQKQQQSRKVHNQQARLLTNDIGKQIPDSFDWRDHMLFTPIKNQGQCNSGWAFSTVAFYQQQLIIYSNNTLNDTLDLSQQYLIYCNDNNFQCSGGFIDLAIENAIANKGLPSQSSLPYDPKAKNSSKQFCSSSNLNNYIIQIPQDLRMSYFNITDQDQIKRILLKKPVIVTVCGVDLKKYTPTNNKRQHFCRSGNKIRNHAVLLIGYTETEWIIKNSFGVEWGLSGYAYITRNPKHDCGIGDELHTTGEQTVACQIRYCQICAQQEKCLQCTQKRFISQINGEDRCQLCDVLNCINCYDITGLCKECADGYALYDQQFTCQPSILSHCIQIMGFKCVKCQQGVQLTALGRCECPILKCGYCPYGVCKRCLPGYHLILLPDQKYECILNECDLQNCLLCLTSQYCHICYDGYNNQNGKCKLNHCIVAKDCLKCSYEYCFQCKDQMIYDQSYYKCRNISFKYCKLYNSQYRDPCRQCEIGYHLDQSNSHCINCTDINCNSCQYQTPSQCIKCRNGYIISNNQVEHKCLKNNCTQQDCQLCSQDNQYCFKCKNIYHAFNIYTLKCQSNCSIKYCIQCLPGQDTCYKCQAGYLLSNQNYKSQCNFIQLDNCIQGVQNHCFICQSNYGKVFHTITGMSRCHRNCIDFCQQCDLEDLSICKQCIPGFILVMNKDHMSITCQQEFNLVQIPHCINIQRNLTHTFNSFTLNCLQCQQFYIFNQLIGECVPENIDCKAGCEACSLSKPSTKRCKCIANYSYKIENKECILVKDQNCDQFIMIINVSECFKCQNGYILNETLQKCVLKQCSVKNCQKCFNTFQNICQKCMLGFYINSLNQCQKCRQYACISCYIVQGYQKCIQCKQYFYLNEQKICYSIYQFYTDIVNGKFVCNPGYYLDQNDQFLSKCNICPFPNCSGCNKTHCFECLAGSYSVKIDLDYICAPCLLNCDICDSSSSCQKCSERYYFDDSKSVCMKMNHIQKGIVMINQTPFRCSYGCYRCINSTVCIDCIIGFTLKNGECLKCKDKCSSCMSQNVNLCQKCFDIYQMSVSQIKECEYRSTYPQTCTLWKVEQPMYSDSFPQMGCYDCLDGYYLTGKYYPCYQCPQLCKKCINWAICTECMDGFILNNNSQCVQCLSQCSLCRQFPHKCILKCKDGQIQINGSCILCDKNCFKCFNQSTCLQCLNGFYLKQGSCNYKCPQGCYDCNEANQCMQCFAGYKLNNSTSQCEHDISCNLNTSCQTCPVNYSLKNKTCIECSKIDLLCIECSFTNNSICLKCASPYYVQQNKCLQCSSHCKQCLDDQLCSDCIQNAFLVLNVNNQYGYCFMCNKNCKTCQGVNNRCTSCQKQFQLTNHSTCINKLRISITLHLDISFSEYFKSLSNITDYFLKQIYQYSNVQFIKRRVKLVSITEGSTIIELQIGLPEPDDYESRLKYRKNSTSLQIEQNVKLSLSKCAQIAGMKVISIEDIKLIGYIPPELKNTGSIPDAHIEFTLSAQAKIALIIVFSFVGFCILAGLYVNQATHYNFFTRIGNFIMELNLINRQERSRPQRPQLILSNIQINRQNISRSNIITNNQIHPLNNRNENHQESLNNLMSLKSDNIQINQNLQSTFHQQQINKKTSNKQRLKIKQKQKMKQRINNEQRNRLNKIKQQAQYSIFSQISSDIEIKSEVQMRRSLNKQKTLVKIVKSKSKQEYQNFQQLKKIFIFIQSDKQNNEQLQQNTKRQLLINQNKVQKEQALCNKFSQKSQKIEDWRINIKNILSHTNRKSRHYERNRFEQQAYLIRFIPEFIHYYNNRISHCEYVKTDKKGSVRQEIKQQKSNCELKDQNRLKVIIQLIFKYISSKTFQMYEQGCKLFDKNDISRELFQYLKNSHQSWQRIYSSELRKLVQIQKELKQRIDNIKQIKYEKDQQNNIQRIKQYSPNKQSLSTQFLKLIFQNIISLLLDIKINLQGQIQKQSIYQQKKQQKQINTSHKKLYLHLAMNITILFDIQFQQNPFIQELQKILSIQDIEKLYDYKMLRQMNEYNTSLCLKSLLKIFGI